MTRQLDIISFIKGLDATDKNIPTFRREVLFFDEFLKSSQILIELPLAHQFSGLNFTLSLQNQFFWSFARYIRVVFQSLSVHLLSVLGRFYLVKEIYNKRVILQLPVFHLKFN